MQLARLADCPALAMPEAEAKAFLTAWQNYLRHLSIEATQRTVDLMTAVGVTVFMYTPRAYALVQRRQQGTRPPPPQWGAGPAQVFQFHPPPPQPQPQPPQPQPGAAVEPEEQPEHLH